MPFVSVRKHRLFYEWRGDFSLERETVVFLHDGLGAVGSWRDVPERIGRAAGMNALVYDRYGYGRSEPRARFPYGFMNREAPVLGALLRRLGLERVHLVGHSDGGSIALLFAAQEPARVLSLVTEAAHTFVEDKTREGIQVLMEALAAGNPPAWLCKLHGARAETLLRAWGQGWLSARHRQWNILAQLQGVRAPLFVLQGDEDEFGTEAQVASIKQRVPHAETWLVGKCGHTPHSEVAEVFERRVSAHLLRHRRTGRAGAGAIGRARPD
jgi:pimeloyl-ACP methyl ester carboxylesterase